MNDAYRSSPFGEVKADGSQQDSTSPPIGLGAKATPVASAAWAQIDFEPARDFLAALAPDETHFTFQTFDDSEAKPQTGAGDARLSRRKVSRIVAPFRTWCRRVCDAEQN